MCLCRPLHGLTFMFGMRVGILRLSPYPAHKFDARFQGITRTSVSHASICTLLRRARSFSSTWVGPYVLTSLHIVAHTVPLIIKGEVETCFASKGPNRSVTGGITLWMLVYAHGSCTTGAFHKLATSFRTTHGVVCASCKWLPLCQLNTADI